MQILRKKKKKNFDVITHIYEINPLKKLNDMGTDGWHAWQCMHGPHNTSLRSHFGNNYGNLSVRRPLFIYLFIYYYYFYLPLFSFSIDDEDLFNV